MFTLKCLQTFCRFRLKNYLQIVERGRFFESSRSLRDEFKYLYCIDQEVDMEMSMFYFKEHRHYIETGNGFIIFHKRGCLKTVHCDCLGSDNRFHNNSFQIKITAHRVASTMIYGFCDFNISCLHIH